jgi:hypothetical protein
MTTGSILACGIEPCAAPEQANLQTVRRPCGYRRRLLHQAIRGNPFKINGSPFRRDPYSRNWPQIDFKIPE